MEQGQLYRMKHNNYKPIVIIRYSVIIIVQKMIKHRWIKCIFLKIIKYFAEIIFNYYVNYFLGQTESHTDMQTK